MNKYTTGAHLYVWLVALTGVGIMLLFESRWGAYLLILALFLDIVVVNWNSICKRFSKKSDPFPGLNLPDNFDHDMPEASAIKFALMQKRVERVIASTKNKKITNRKTLERDYVPISFGLERPVEKAKELQDPGKTPSISVDQAPEYSKRFSKPAVLFQPLHPLLFGAGVLNDAKCWIGGRPKLPPDMHWPRDRNKRPLHFVAQFDCSTLPVDVAQACRIPTAGTIYLFAILDGEFLQILDDPSQSQVLFKPQAGHELLETAPPEDGMSIYFMDGYSNNFERCGISPDKYKALVSLPKLPLEPRPFTSYPNISQLKSLCEIDGSIQGGEAHEHIRQLNIQALANAMNIDTKQRWDAYERLFQAVTAQTGSEVPAYNFFCKHVAGAYRSEIHKRRDAKKAEQEEDAVNQAVSALDGVIAYCDGKGLWSETSADILNRLNGVIAQSHQIFGDALMTHLSNEERFHHQARANAQKELRRLILSAAIDPPERALPKPLQDGLSHFFDPVREEFVTRRSLKTTPTKADLHQLGGFYDSIQSDITGINCGGDVLFKLSDDSSCGFTVCDAGHLFVRRKPGMAGKLDFQELLVVTEGH